MENISPKGVLSPKEAERSIRDAVITSVGGLIPVVLEILGATDFGEHTVYASIILTIITPLLNRALNIWRVK